MTLLLLAALWTIPARAADYDAAAKAAREVLAELIAADTTNPPGNEAKAAAIGAQRLKADGIAFEVSEFAPGRRNLVARLRGSGKQKPLLLIAHTDVVGAQNQAWTSPPHELTEVGDFLVGRGTHDDLGMAAVALEVFRLLNRDGARLRRDVLLAWTGDEESGGEGILHLLSKRRKSVEAGLAGRSPRFELPALAGAIGEAGLALNEGGGLILGDDGRVAFAEVQVAEKTYQDYELVARGTTGHSSVPQPDNAIYRLAQALSRLAQSPPPVRLLPVTRAYFAGRAPIEKPPLAAAMKAVAEGGGDAPKDALETLERDPFQAANLRTTCVATMLSAGTRVNALPPEAKANVNCRLLPDESPEKVKDWLKGVLADPAIEVRYTKDFGTAEASPVDGEALAAIRKVAGEMFPGAAVIPTMSRGATDSRHLRAAGIPSYGIHPVALTESDDARAHGIDERIPKSSLRTGVEFLHRLVMELAEEQD